MDKGPYRFPVNLPWGEEGELVFDEPQDWQDIEGSLRFLYRPQGREEGEWVSVPCRAAIRLKDGEPATVKIETSEEYLDPVTGQSRPVLFCQTIQLAPDVFAALFGEEDRIIVQVAQEACGELFEVELHHALPSEAEAYVRLLFKGLDG